MRPAPAARLLLHIGAEKTGTTAIQRTLARNRALLARHGVLYPRSPGESNHFDLGVHCLEEGRSTPLRRLRGIDDAGKLAAARAAIESALAAEVAAAAPRLVILSNEQLSSNVREPGEAARLLAFLAPLAREVEVVCYLRRQDEMALSAYSTEVKAGRATRFDPARVPADAVKYDFERMLGLWAGARPGIGLRVRPYDRRAIGEDVVGDFAALAGIEGIPLVPVARQNPSLDVHALELLRLMNPHLPRHGDPGRLRGNLQEILAAASDGPRPRLSAEDSARILARFAEGNRRVRERWFADLAFDPFAPPEAGAAVPEGPPRTTPALLGEYAARLWLAKQEQFLAAKGDGEPR